MPHYKRNHIFESDQPVNGALSSQFRKEAEDFFLQNEDFYIENQYNPYIKIMKLAYTTINLSILIDRYFSSTPNTLIDKTLFDRVNFSISQLLFVEPSHPFFRDFLSFPKKTKRECINDLMQRKSPDTDHHNAGRQYGDEDLYHDLYLLFCTLHNSIFRLTPANELPRCLRNIDHAVSLSSTDRYQVQRSNTLTTHPPDLLQDVLGLSIENRKFTTLPPDLLQDVLGLSIQNGKVNEIKVRLGAITNLFVKSLSNSSALSRTVYTALENENRLIQDQREGIQEDVYRKKRRGANKKIDSISSTLDTKLYSHHTGKPSDQRQDLVEGSSFLDQQIALAISASFESNANTATPAKKQQEAPKPPSEDSMMQPLNIDFNALFGPLSSIDSRDFITAPSNPSPSTFTEELKSIDFNVLRNLDMGIRENVDPLGDDFLDNLVEDNQLLLGSAISSMNCSITKNNGNELQGIGNENTIAALYGFPPTFSEQYSLSCSLIPALFPAMPVILNEINLHCTAVKKSIKAFNNLSSPDKQLPPYEADITFTGSIAIRTKELLRAHKNYLSRIEGMDYSMIKRHLDVIDTTITNAIVLVECKPLLPFLSGIIEDLEKLPSDEESKRKSLQQKHVNTLLELILSHTGATNHERYQGMQSILNTLFLYLEDKYKDPDSLLIRGFKAEQTVMSLFKRLISHVQAVIDDTSSIVALYANFHEEQQSIVDLFVPPPSSGNQMNFHPAIASPTSSLFCNNLFLAGKHRVQNTPYQQLLKDLDNATNKESAISNVMTSLVNFLFDDSVSNHSLFSSHKDVENFIEILLKKKKGASESTMETIDSTIDILRATMSSDQAEDLENRGLSMN